MSKNTYIIVDTNNMFFRARHSVMGDIDTKVGMAFHVLFSSLRKVWNEYGGTHVIFATEGKSWRYKYSENYKIQRKLDKIDKSPAEQEEDEIFMEALNELIEFIDKRTNCTVVNSPNAEADDIIALWIQQHPDDNHVIVSSDSDFVQLLDDNVVVHDGVMGRTLKKDGVYNDKGQKVEFTVKSDSKIKTGKPNPNFVPEREDWYKYALFLKCIRGDKSDSIFSAYPGAKVKGSRNRVGINEAYEDKDTKGYNYNNFMLQRWTDHNGVEHRVGECYEKNRLLIDLTQQPEEIKKEIIEDINTQVSRKKVNGAGIHFLKFCKKWDLVQLSKYPNDIAKILNASYQP